MANFMKLAVAKIRVGLKVAWLLRVFLEIESLMVCKMFRYFFDFFIDIYKITALKEVYRQFLLLYMQKHGGHQAREVPIFPIDASFFLLIFLFIHIVTTGDSVGN